MLKWSYLSDIWQASRQRSCRGACQIYHRSTANWWIPYDIIYQFNLITMTMRFSYTLVLIYRRFTVFSSKISTMLSVLWNNIFTSLLCTTVKHLIYFPTEDAIEGKYQLVCLTIPKHLFAFLRGALNTVANEISNIWGDRYNSAGMESSLSMGCRI